MHRIILLRGNAWFSWLFSVMNDRENGNAPKKWRQNTELMINFLAIAHIFLKYISSSQTSLSQSSAPEIGAPHTNYSCAEIILIKLH